jgi:hypothetical protein
VNDLPPDGFTPSDPLLRTPMGRAMANSQARREMESHHAPPALQTDYGPIAVFVLVVVMPVFLLAAAVLVLGSWLSTHTVWLRERLESSSLSESIATTPDGAGGDPWRVAGTVLAGVVVVAVTLTIGRWILRAAWARSSLSWVPLALGVLVLSAARAIVLVGGVALAGVSGGIARGSDLDPSFTSEGGMHERAWPIGVTVATLVLAILLSTWMSTRRGVRARRRILERDGLAEPKEYVHADAV